jgi:carbonic anhydrase
VASGLAKGELTLHGWFFEIETGQIQAYNGDTGQFEQVYEGAPLPVAQRPSRRMVAADHLGIAAE